MGGAAARERRRDVAVAHVAEVVDVLVHWAPNRGGRQRKLALNCERAVGVVDANDGAHAGEEVRAVGDGEEDGVVGGGSREGGGEGVVGSREGGGQGEQRDHGDKRGVNVNSRVAVARSCCSWRPPRPRARRVNYTW